MLRAAHFGCAIRDVFLSYRHVAAPVGYAKRLSLALNILPRRLFLLLLFFKFHYGYVRLTGLPTIIRLSTLLLPLRAEIS